MAIPLLLMAAVIALVFLIARYFPIYNFCWGDYTEVFKKREAARTFWLVIIGIGFLVSVMGSIVANYLSK